MSGVKHESRNAVPENVRDPIVQALNNRVMDLIVLGVQAMHAHWNVRGPNFMSLHPFFQVVAGACLPAAPACDALAERIGQLGRSVSATIPTVAAVSSIAEYPLEISSGDDHVRALSDRLAAFCALLRKDVSEIEALDDLVTADLVRSVLGDMEKLLWLLEAHLQA